MINLINRLSLELYKSSQFFVPPPHPPGPGASQPRTAVHLQGVSSLLFPPRQRQGQEGKTWRRCLLHAAIQSEPIINNTGCRRSLQAQPPAGLIHSHNIHFYIRRSLNIQFSLSKWSVASLNRSGPSDLPSLSAACLLVTTRLLWIICDSGSHFLSPDL